MQIQQSGTPLRDKGMKILATAGLIAILLLGAWGVFVVARSIPGVFSALQSAAVALSSIFVPAERLEITLATMNVESGKPFDLSWNHINKDAEGSYTISYACRDGVSFSAPTPRGVYETAPCGTPFNYTNAENSIRLIPTSARMRFIDVPLTLSVARLSDGKVTATTETTITIENDAVSGTNLPGGGTGGTTGGTGRTPTRTPGTPTTNTYTVVSGSRVSNPNGKPDLTVRIIAIGVMDRATNVFTPTASVVAGQRAAVRFEVENLGDKTAQYWYFNVPLPSWPYHMFHSDSQPALGPGDKIEYTLGFDGADIRATGGILTVNVDPGNSLFEASESNNIAKVKYTILTP